MVLQRQLERAHSDIGTTMKLYCGDKLITEFNRYNVDIDTDMYQGYGPGDYWLNIRAINNVPIVAPCDIHENVYLVWTNRHNTNESYKLDLTKINIVGDSAPIPDIDFHLMGTLEGLSDVSNLDPATVYNTATSGDITVTFTDATIGTDDYFYWVLRGAKANTGDVYLNGVAQAETSGGEVESPSRFRLYGIDPDWLAGFLVTPTPLSRCPIKS